MRAYKGFTPQPDGTMKCLTKTYKPGETYTEPSAVVCQRGMHACTDSLHVFSYYPAATSVFHEVEVDDDAKGDGTDSKVVSKTLTIGASVDVFGMVKVGLDLLWKRVGAAKSEAESKAREAHASPAGELASGDRGTAAASGDRGTAAASGDRGTAAASGNRGTAAASGDQGTAAASGDQGTAAASGDHSVALAAGYQGRAKASTGCVLSLVERADWEDDFRILAAKSVIVGHKSGGKRIKADTWYSLIGGKVVEVNANGEAVA